MLDSVAADDISQFISVPLREVQEPLERLRLAHAGELGHCPAVLSFQRREQAPQVPRGVGAGICPVEQRTDQLADTIELGIPCFEVILCYRTVRQGIIFRESRQEYLHGSNDATSSGRIHGPA